MNEANANSSKWFTRGALVTTLCVVCAVSESGRLAIKDGVRLLTGQALEFDVLAARGGSRALAALERHGAEAATQLANGGADEILAAAELRRLAILEELGDDAEIAARDLAAATSDGVAEYPDRRDLLAGHVDALRTQRFLLAQVNAPDPVVTSDLVESLLALRESEPENGYPVLLLAEAALLEGRIHECRDALLEAGRCDRIDPELESRYAVVSARLIAAGESASRTNEMLVLGGYGAAALRPGQTLEFIARELARRGGADLVDAESSWVRCWFALSRIAVALAHSTLLLEDAADVLRAPSIFLQELAAVAPRQVPVEVSKRQEVVERELRDLGLGPAAESVANGALLSRSFAMQAARRIGTAQKHVEDTRRLDAMAAAQSIFFSWSILAALAFCVLRFVASRRAITPSPSPMPSAAHSTFLRAFAIVLPTAALFFAVAGGLAPFDRGGGADRILAGFAEPNLAVITLPVSSMLIFLALGGALSFRSRRESLARSGAELAFSLLAIYLVVATVSLRSIENLREKRARAVSSLLAEPFLSGYLRQASNSQ